MKLMKFIFIFIFNFFNILNNILQIIDDYIHKYVLIQMDLYLHLF